MAGWNALTGARGIVAAFLMSTLIQLGVVDVRLGLLLCAAASTTGVLLFARAARDGVASAVTSKPTERDAVAVAAVS